jgi:beta-glucanase (GH16 family)
MQAAPERLSLAGLAETLNQEFREPPIWRPGALQVQSPIRPLNDPGFSWAAGYIWNHPLGAGRLPWPPPQRNFPAWTSNGNAESSPNGDMITQIVGAERAPLTWAGTLKLSVHKMSEDLLGTIGKQDPKDYMGATINSFPYAQQFGVFAISAKLPRGNGLWPKFVLLPADKSWPPDIAIMQAIGRQPGNVYMALHTRRPAKDQEYDSSFEAGLDLASAFHEYAVDWGPDRIRWYFDRKLVFSLPTPADLHQPCYLLVNVAVGTPGDWGGAPDDSTAFPATMEVAYIKAWQRPEYTNGGDSAHEGRPNHVSKLSF